MTKTNLLLRSSELSEAWRSVVVGRAANATVKVLRMDGTAYPNEAHNFDEALLVLEGHMNLEIGNQVVRVRGGEVFIVPAGMPHAVARPEVMELSSSSTSDAYPLGRGEAQQQDARPASPRRLDRHE